MPYDDVRVARSSRVTGFTLSFLTGIVVGMLATFAAITGRIAAVEVQVKNLIESVQEVKQEQGKQRDAVESLSTQVAGLRSDGETSAANGDIQPRRPRKP